MPYRIQIASFCIVSLLEGLALVGVASYQAIAGVFDDTTWDRMKGGNGALFIMGVGLLVGWNHMRRSAKLERERREREEIKEDIRREKEEASREARSQQMIKMQTDNSDRILQITAEGILAQGKTARAIERLDSTNQKLTMEIKDMTCFAEKYKPIT